MSIGNMNDTGQSSRRENNIKARNIMQVLVDKLDGKNGEPERNRCVLGGCRGLDDFFCLPFEVRVVIMNCRSGSLRQKGLSRLLF